MIYRVKSYYCRRDGKLFGPFSATELRVLASQSRLQPSDMISAAGRKDWVQAHRVRGLFSGQPEHAGEPRGPSIPNGKRRAIDDYQNPASPHQKERNMDSAPTPPPVQSTNHPEQVGTTSSGQPTIVAFDTGQVLKFAWPLLAGSLLSCVLALLWFNLKNAPQPAPFPPATSTLNSTFDAQRTQRSNELKQVQKKSQELRQQLEKANGKLRDYEDMQEFMKHWKSADLMLINPGQAAVGLKDIDGAFQVTAMQDGPRADFAAYVGSFYHIPRLMNVGNLTGAILRDAVAGEMLTSALTAQLRQHWKAQRFVPAEPEDQQAQFVAFWDNREKRSRVGFYLGHDDTGIDMQGIDELPNRIGRSRIAPGTARVGTAREMRLDHSIDALDLAMLLVGQRLGTVDQPGFRAVAVEVGIDELDEAMEMSMRMDDTSTDNFFERYARARGETFREDSRKRETRALRRWQDVVLDDVRDMLARLNVDTVEREDLAEVQNERNLTYDSNFDSVEFRALYPASHILHVDLGRPRDGGEYRLSVRLVDVNSGSSYSVFAGDHFTPVREQPANFMLASGGIYERLKNGRAAELAVIDPLGHGKYSMRRLVSNAPETISKQDFESHFSSSPVQDVADVPIYLRPQMLNYQISRAVRPVAGRITQVTADMAVLNIGSQHGIDRNDRLQVVRVDESQLGSMRTGMMMTSLPLQLDVSDLTQAQTRVAVADLGLRSLWDQEVLRVGDLVVRNADREPRVAFVWRYDDELESQKIIHQLRLKTPEQKDRLQRELQGTVARLIERLQSELSRQDVAVVQDADGVMFSVKSADIQDFQQQRNRAGDVGFRRGFATGQGRFGAAPIGFPDGVSPGRARAGGGSNWGSDAIAERSHATRVQSSSEIPLNGGAVTQERLAERDKMLARLPTHTVEIAVGARRFNVKTPLYNWRVTVVDNDTGRSVLVTREFELGASQIDNRRRRS